MSKDKKKGGFLKFLSGALVGAGLGVLFAPKEGSETRRELKVKIDELLLKVKDIDAAEVKKDIENKIEQIKESLADLDKETVLKVAKKKAEEIKVEAEKLVEYVVEKGTPVLKSAAEAVRSKAVDATKVVLDKLEKNDSK